MALLKIKAFRAALVVRVTVPPDPVPKVAVSLVERMPSRPGVPPLASQLARFVQKPDPLVQVACPL